MSRMDRSQYDFVEKLLPKMPRKVKESKKGERSKSKEKKGKSKSKSSWPFKKSACASSPGTSIFKRISSR